MPTKTRAKKTSRTKPATGKRLSALDAAAKVLARTKKDRSCRELIEAMAAQGLWTSPAGKTPDASLYSAIMREIAAKGKESRFRKTGPGRFAANR